MSGAGKGDDYRPIDYKKWYENYDRIFGKKSNLDLSDNSAPNETPDKKESP